ncbi:MAG: hypothetical protein CMB80_12170 [Flammeovirgaceae bacterium]|nr:hypothetical protein [Flammeovirgaceae bacterium]MBR08290.1 hypothetical protein [Rickettsiales bacterium]|tara:strand:+ start:3015 stop:3827 length:813 start_codon:yes stop_codon:yes gene_type:complete
MAQTISKKLSFIGENIKKIRQVKKISQAEFSGLFNLARPSVGAYEEGRSEPKIETIIQIATYFRISIDVLLTRKLTVDEIFNLEQHNETLKKAHKPHPSELVPVDLASRSGISLVQTNHYLEYLVQYKTADFFHKLPKIQLPLENPENYRAFEMNGSEMEYHQQGLHHGDLLIGVLIDWKNLSDYSNKTFTVVHKKNITTRRLKSFDDKQITLSTDDPNYPILSIAREDIFEIWLIRSVYSSYLNPPTLLEERVLSLEKEIKDIKQEIKK